MFIVFDHPTVHKNKNALGILYFHYDVKKMVYATFNQNSTLQKRVKVRVKCLEEFFCLL